MNAHDPNFSTRVHVAKCAVDLIRPMVSEDDPSFLTLVESETDVLESLRHMLRGARHAEADAKKLGGMIEEMQDRKSRFMERAEGLRGAVTWALDELGIKRLEAPDFTATVSAGRPKVVVTDETLLPDELCRIRREPDKARIKEFLESGNQLQGAALGNPKPVLTMRVR